VFCLTNAEAQKIIAELFTVAGVRRVISIDDAYFDEYPVEAALAVSQQLDAESFARGFAMYLRVAPPNDLDIRGTLVRETWPALTAEDRRQAMRSLNAQLPVAAGASGRGDGLDELTTSLLPELFKAYDPRFLSLTKWRVQKEALLIPDMPLTLILVDEDFSKEDAGKEEGLRVIKDVLSSPNTDTVLCALLSHKYGRDGIHEKWDELCRRQEIDKSRFVLIPKSFLLEDLIGFARLLKLAILNGSVQVLKAKALDILRGAIGQSATRLESIDIYDFDQIVFRSSFREGVWELDTLFRIFGLFHRDETRKVAKADVALHELAAKIRTVSQISTKSDSAPNYNTIQLERLEIYEDADYLNSHFTPIELGDIFEVTRESEKKRFVLLAQPCDLMVRSDGNRHHAVMETTLAEIVAGDHEGLEGFAQLPFLDKDSSTMNYVALRKVFAVNLLALDFCAYQTTGESRFALADACPQTVIPAWCVRHGKISRIARKILAKVEEMDKAGTKVADAIQIVARCSNHRWLIPDVDVANKSLSYNLKRVGRLRQLRAAALLSRYANFLSRYAFDHDLGERPSKGPGGAEGAVPLLNEPASKEETATNTHGPATSAPPPAQA
jgi:hypothetical protein